MKLFLVALCALSVVLCEEEKKEEKKDVGTVIGIDLGTTYSWWAQFIYEILIFDSNSSVLFIKTFYQDS